MFDFYESVSVKHLFALIPTNNIVVAKAPYDLYSAIAATQYPVGGE